jgi:hypothetical protein
MGLPDMTQTGAKAKNTVSGHRNIRTLPVFRILTEKSRP